MNNIYWGDCSFEIEDKFVGDKDGIRCIEVPPKPFPMEFEELANAITKNVREFMADPEKMATIVKHEFIPGHKVEDGTRVVNGRKMPLPRLDPMFAEFDGSDCGLPPGDS